MEGIGFSGVGAPAAWLAEGEDADEDADEDKDAMGAAVKPASVSAFFCRSSLWFVAELSVLAAAKPLGIGFWSSSVVGGGQ